MDKGQSFQQMVLQQLVIYMQNIGEGNGTPLQYSCLEDPMGGGAW